MKKLSKNPNRVKNPKNATLSGKVSKKDVLYIRDKAKKFGISQADFIVLAVKNAVETGAIWKSRCKSCGFESSHDECGIIESNYIVSVESCINCNATGADFTDYP